MIDLVEDKKEALHKLCSKYNVKRLELFGSAAEDAFDASRSDIDFLVEFQPGVDIGPWMSHYFNLRRELETLFDCGVDLVMISAFKNPYFIREVNRTRRLLYAA